MDPSLCVIETTVIVFIPHSDLIKLFWQRPPVSFAIRREP